MSKTKSWLFEKLEESDNTEYLQNALKQPYKASKRVKGTYALPELRLRLKQRFKSNKVRNV